MKDLPEELQYLRNLIESAKINYSVENLRDIIKSAADEAPAADVIQMAELIFRRGTEVSRSRMN